jgi:prepilin-type N-terminal cleavage/methylation domain-containing protein
MIRGNERGFTLPELIVTTVFLVMLAGLATWILSPANQMGKRLDAERRTGVAMIVQGVNRYIAETGELPVYVPDKQTPIGTSGTEYDVCLVTPVYLPRVPMDPQNAVVEDADGNTVETDVIECDDVDTLYSAGYTIQKKDGRVEIGAGLSDGSDFILSSTAAPEKAD